MNVACPECRSVFRVDPAKVPDVAVRARCSVCGGVITVMPEQATAASAPRPSFASAPAPSAPRPMPRATFTPARPATPVSPATPPAATPAGPVRRTAIPFMGPRSGAPASPRPATPPRAPSAPVFRPSAVPPIAAPVAAPAPTPATPTSPTTPATPAAPARRTPINPFLSNDPNVKAKRLARALVSDLIVYFPQKRDEGLRDGNLKEIFREEIKKSYEEFVDQVGKEFADSTSHFTDALNEILAAGQPVFSGPYTG